MRVEVLVEEPSAEGALRILLPRILGTVPFDIRVFQGKADLLKKLPQRLAGYASWIQDADTRIVVLVDRDRDDCRVLKARLEEMVAKSGLTTRATAGRDRAQVLLRIAVEELEAWLLGDPLALRAAFPRLPESLGSRAAYRDPDAINGTWEALERLINRYGYQTGGLLKVRTAAEVARHMDVERNSSASFAAFRDGVRRLMEVPRAEAG